MSSRYLKGGIGIFVNFPLRVRVYHQGTGIEIFVNFPLRVGAKRTYDCA
jgi:hypothetical protein